ncbi:MAG: hypothetical protein KAF91_27690 [Nostoc sp. TH1S01]|nr:hypothetical protein [Nostoc sp. TH1S01]
MATLAVVICLKSMKLSSDLVIQDEKLTKYLLVYQTESDKSGYLALASYSLDNWEVFKSDIIKAMEVSEIAKVKQTNWGIQFEVKSEWYGTNGRLIKVITIWQQDEGSDSVRFITIKPDRSQEN